MQKSGQAGFGHGDVGGGMEDIRGGLDWIQEDDGLYRDGGD